MKMQWIGVVFLGLSTVAMATQNVETAPIQGKLSVEVLAKGASKSISYNDDKGQPISKQAFLDQIRNGREFSYKRDEVHASTAFMLVSPNATFKVDSEKAVNTALHENYKVHSGDKFPAFKLTTLGGDDVSRMSLQGHPSVIQFFFAQCVTCFTGNAVLDAYAKSHPEVSVLAVTNDDKHAAGTYAQTHHLTWPVAYAGQSLIDGLGIKAFPTFALVGADGRLLDIRLGGQIGGRDGDLSEHDLDKWVRHTLSHHPR